MFLNAEQPHTKQKLFLRTVPLTVEPMDVQTWEVMREHVMILPTIFGTKLTMFEVSEANIIKHDMGSGLLTSI